MVYGFFRNIKKTGPKTELHFKFSIKTKTSKVHRKCCTRSNKKDEYLYQNNNNNLCHKKWKMGIQIQNQNYNFNDNAITTPDI